jgi:hypothetical protein
MTPGTREEMTMTQKSLLRPEGVVSSPAFSHVAIVPPDATTIYIARTPSTVTARSSAGPTSQSPVWAFRARSSRSARSRQYLSRES